MNFFTIQRIKFDKLVRGEDYKRYRFSHIKVGMNYQEYKRNVHRYVVLNTFKELTRGIL